MYPSPTPPRTMLFRKMSKESIYCISQHFGGRAGGGEVAVAILRLNSCIIFLDMDQVHVHVVNNLVQDSWLPSALLTSI